jgi:subtilisin family serine protease
LLLMAVIAGWPAQTPSAISDQTEIEPRQALPSQMLIVQTQNVESVIDHLLAHQVPTIDQLPIIDAVVAADREGLRTSLLELDTVKFVVGNRGIRATGIKSLGKVMTNDSDYPASINAKLLDAEGYLAAGVKIAMIDSGLKAHKVLLRNASNQNRLLAFHDVLDGVGYPIDGYGHGTHLAAIAVSIQSTVNGGYKGIAPEADLVVVRAFDETGKGAYLSALQTLNWVFDHHQSLDIRVLNLSFSVPAQSFYWDDPVNRTLMKLWDAGVWLLLRREIAVLSR